MTTTQKAIILGLLTEGIAVSFIVLDARLGIGAAHDALSLRHAPRAFYFLARWTHWPAVVVLGLLNALAEAVLGLSGGQPVFFAGFGTGSPAWSAICLAQAVLWVGVWGAALTASRSIRRRFFPVCLAGLCVVGLAACTKPSPPGLYDPAQAPLDADELAQLLGVYHWKINELPASDKPYWGVRVVALRPDHTVADESTTEQFVPGVTTGGNGQALVGLKDEPDGVSGTLMLGSRPNAVWLTRFKFAYASNDRGEQAAIGLIWHDDRAELMSFVDRNRQKTFIISVELLHERPK